MVSFKRFYVKQWNWWKVQTDVGAMKEETENFLISWWKEKSFNKNQFRLNFVVLTKCDENHLNHQGGTLTKGLEDSKISLWQSVTSTRNRYKLEPLGNNAV